MRRLTVVLLLFVLFVLPLLWSAAPPTRSIVAAEEPAKKAEPTVPPNRSEELIAALAREIDFSGYEDPKTSLIEALDQLAKLYRVSFDVNARAFAAEELADVLKTLIAETNPIPPMRKTTLTTVLRKVLERVPARSGATYLIRPQQIEITTFAAVRDEVWGKDYSGPMLPLVHVSVCKVPLEKVLAGLATSSEKSIVLDPRLRDKTGDMPITAQMLNAPLDTSLTVLCDMADLTFVQLDNTFYVTTTDRAAKVKADWMQRRSQVPAKQTKAPPGKAKTDPSKNAQAKK
jgi:hypothetical protein